MEENLPLLRDIHLPPEVSPFPPGYGWFVLLALVVAAYAAYRLGKILYRKSKKHYALKLLESATAENLDSVRLFSEILRRICRLKFPEAVSLSGPDWLAFLNAHSKVKIADKPAELLVYAPYIAKSNKFEQSDYETVRRFIKKWIGENL